MYAIVDLETTGSKPGFDKIIEIAIFVHDGQKIIDEFSSLVNPGKEIPPFIARMTGISDEMVATAPGFEVIAPRVMELLKDRVFVAHNAQFDYPFLVNALSAEGFAFESQTLCTCKTSRRLLPGYPSYSLGNLCRSLSIELHGAHRAYADAKATTLLLEELISVSNGKLDYHISTLEKLPWVTRITELEVQSLPSATGILYIYDDDGIPIFISKTNNIRKKALTILLKSKTKKYKRLVREGLSTGFEITGSMLVAAIREFQLRCEFMPRYSQPMNVYESRFGIYDIPGADNRIELKVEKVGILRSKPVVIFASEIEANTQLNQAWNFVNSENSLMELNQHADADFWNSQVESVIAVLEKKRRHFVIFDTGPDPDGYYMINVNNAMFQGMGVIDRESARQTPLEPADWIKKMSDHPVIFHNVVRCISQGKYLKIENIEAS